MKVGQVKVDQGPLSVLASPRPAVPPSSGQRERERLELLLEQEPNLPEVLVRVDEQLERVKREVAGMKDDF